METAVSALLDAQRRFARALRSAQGEPAMLPLLTGDAERNRGLLGVYRGNAVADHFNQVLAGSLTAAIEQRRRAAGRPAGDGSAR